MRQGYGMREWGQRELVGAGTHQDAGGGGWGVRGVVAKLILRDETESSERRRAECRQQVDQTTGLLHTKGSPLLEPSGIVCIRERGRKGRHPK